jgi:hypothetical protein
VFDAKFYRTFKGNVTVTVTDTNNNTSQFSNPVPVFQKVNQLPNAGNDAYATAENAPLTVAATAGVLANDSDPDSDPLTAVLVTGPANGQVKLNTDGSFTYTPNTFFNGTDSFTYDANDGQANSNPATVTVTVTAVNQPPVANPDTVSTTAGTPLNIPAPNLLANDTPGPPNESGQTLTVIAVGGAVNGTVSLTNGVVTFTPAPQFTGTAGFTYTIEDDGTTGGQPDPKSATGTVTVTVTPPVAVATTTTVNSPADPSVFGQAVSFTAAVTAAASSSGPPTGAVQFLVDGVDFGAPVPLTNGTAQSQSTATLAPGPHTVTAVYSGDAHFGGSTGGATQTVNRDTTTITLSSTATTTAAGQPVNFSTSMYDVAPGAWVVPPTGTITFEDTFDGVTTALVTITLGGSGKTPAFTAVGVHHLTAVYSGDGDYAGSTSNEVDVTVVGAS